MNIQTSLLEVFAVGKLGVCCEYMKDPLMNLTASVAEVSVSRSRARARVIRERARASNFPGRPASP